MSAQKKILITFLLACLCVAFSSFSQTTSIVKQRLATIIANSGIVRVTVVKQTYNYPSSWREIKSEARYALGVVVEHHRILVDADVLRDASIITVQGLKDNRPMKARIQHVDYEADLALLVLEDASFFEMHPAISFSSENVAVGGEVFRPEVKQRWSGYGSTDSVSLTPARVWDLRSQPYLHESWFLAYSIQSSANSNLSSFLSLPFFDSRGSLCGIQLSRKSEDVSAISMIPLQVIRHFIRDAQGDTYRGFPQLPFSFEPFATLTSLNPHFREWTALPSRLSGVYVSKISPELLGQADVKVGDIITHINNRAIREDGKYKDSKYGTLDIRELPSRFFQGEVIKFSLWRNKSALQSNWNAAAYRPFEFLVPPYTTKPPRYLLVGGFIFHELSGETPTSDFSRLGFYQRHPGEFSNLLQRRKRIVYLATAIPNSLWNGFEDMDQLIVVSVNGRPIKDLEDLLEASKHPILIKERLYHRFNFTHDPKVVYVSADDIQKIYDEFQRLGYKISKRDLYRF